MSRGNPGKGANAERTVAGDAAPHPGVVWQAAEERQRRRPYGLEFLNHARPRSVVGGGCRDRHVLVEAWQWRVEAAGKPEGAKHEQPLGVAQVTDDLADAPFAVSVAMQRLLVG